MVGAVEDIKLMMYDQKDVLVKIFDDLEVAHDRMVCGRMLSLSKVLDPWQLMIVMKATI